MSGLAELLGRAPCDCGRCRPITTERAALTRELAPALLAEAQSRPLLLLGDSNTLAACGTALCGALADAGARASAADLTRDDGASPHADAATVERVVQTIAAEPDDTLPVAVGSGTISDLTKAAAARLERRYVAVGTAASMNGYTSAVAAVTVDGVKRTLNAAPPVAVLADPEVLTRSPRAMTRSGLADLLSKPVSSADWRLTHLLWDDPYCPAPTRLADAAVERAVALARELEAPGTQAVAALFEALLVSGISMATAGTSSPASGGEHLISHFLDMTAHCSPAPGGRTPALHGEQVGVGTRISTRLYRRVLSRSRDDVDWLGAVAAAAGVESIGAELERAPWLTDDVRRGLAEQGARKLHRLGDREGRTERVRACWPLLREALLPDVDAAERYLGVLPSVGAPLTAAAIGVSDGRELVAAYRLGRFVRDRYTILDLAGDLGLLGPLEEKILEGML